MNLTAVLLLAACLQVAAHTQGQTVSFTGKDVPLDKVFSVIKEQTGYVVFFDYTVLDGSKPVTLSVKDAPLEDFLSQILSGQSLDYSIKRKTIVVKRISASAEANDNTTYSGNSSPPITVHGRVVDENGDPVAGASVLEKGTTHGTVTDENGNFELANVDGQATLVVSGSNIINAELKLKNKSTVVVSVKLEVASLNEVVVNKGYYSTKQRFNTGNVTRVDGKDLAAQPVIDPILALQGRVPGLYISQTSGIPGAYSSFQIRGLNSLPFPGRPITGSDPLFIIDGVPFSTQTLTSSFTSPSAVGQSSGYTQFSPTLGRGQGLSPFSTFSPQDIESIEVLKDADATAIYGARGANGVILITTKKGKSGQTRVNVDLSNGGSKVIHEIPLLNTPQYLAYRHEMLNNDGLTPDPLSDFDLTLWDTTRYTNWQRVLIGNTAHFMAAHALISGGNGNTQFSAGFGYNSQGTVFPGNYGNKNASINFNVSHLSFNQRFRFELSGNYGHGDNEIPIKDFTSSITLAPDAPPLYNKNGNLNWAFLGAAYPTFPSWYNPFGNTFVHANSKTDNLVSHVFLSYQILKGLILQTNMGYTHSQMNSLNLFFGNRLPPPGDLDPNSRSSERATGDSKTWNIEPQLNYHKQLGKLSIEGLLGSTFQSSNQSNIAFFGVGYASDVLVRNLAAASISYLNGYTESQYKFNSFYGQLGARWNDKFLLNLTGRRDGSSRFGPDRQFGNFGAVGAGWIFTEEHFFKNHLQWLSMGKLRGSYGVAGNDAIGDYQFLSTYNQYGNGTYQGGIMLQPTSLTNPDFAWERTKKMELGIELSAFKNRLSTSASFYRNRTDNQLVPYILPVFTGFNNVEANLPAIIQNKGWEFTINSTIIQSKKFTWSIAFNFSIPRSKLVAFPNLSISPYRRFYSLGNPLEGRYVYHYTGVNPQTGLYNFATKDGSGIPSGADDLVYSKALTQSVHGGFRNTFSYKGISLDIFFAVVKQNGFSNLAFLPFPAAGVNPQSSILERWRKPGDIAPVQRLSTAFSGDAATAYEYFQLSDGVITDASFIKLKSLALSWQIPKQLLGKAFLDNASVFTHAENVFTITKFMGLDPETQSVSQPTTRTIVVGIHLGF